MSANPCKFVWYELMTTDLAAARDYYGKVIGWQFKDSGMPGGAYWIFSMGPVGVGGAMGLSQEDCAAGARPGWCAYIGVDDVDAYAERVKAAGGAIHRPPADIPNVGRFAVVADPQGAVFMLFKDSSGTQQTPVVPGTPGHIGWHELHAGEGFAAYDFYSKMFGWTKDRAMDMGAMGVYQLFCAGGPAIGGMMTKTPEVPAPFWLYYINVDAADAAAERATRHGGKVLMGPHEVPGGSWIVQCTDPQGAWFAMVAPKR